MVRVRNSANPLALPRASIATTNTAYQDDIDQMSIAAPDGSYIAVDGEMLALGLNIFGHNCLTIGNAFLVNGTL